MKSKEWDNEIDKCNQNSDIVKQNYQLLLQIIDNKTDAEFYVFFKKYIYNFQFKKQYIGYIHNINQNGKVILELHLAAINKFYDVIDFIEKCCFITLVYGRNDYDTSSSPIDERDSYYKELNTFLTDIFNICQKLKEEEQEKKEQEKKELEKKELEKKEQEKKEQEKKELEKKEQEKKAQENIKKKEKKEQEKKELEKKEQEKKELEKKAQENIKKKEKKEQEKKAQEKEAQEKKAQEKKKKKKPISATMKKLVWNINIGEEIGKAKCLCCNSTDITQMSFNCGHIIAEANGGETIVSNLKPICQNCNSSMGTKNMEDFMKTLK